MSREGGIESPGVKSNVCDKEQKASKRSAKHRSAFWLFGNLPASHRPAHL